MLSPLHHITNPACSFRSFVSHIFTDNTAVSGASGSLSGIEKLAKESLDAELEALVAADKRFRDNSGSSGDQGPIYDIVRYVHTF